MVATIAVAARAEPVILCCPWLPADDPRKVPEGYAELRVVPNTQVRPALLGPSFPGGACPSPSALSPRDPQPSTRARLPCSWTAQAGAHDDAVGDLVKVDGGLCGKANTNTGGCQ